MNFNCQTILSYKYIISAIYKNFSTLKFSKFYKYLKLIYIKEKIKEERPHKIISKLISKGYMILLSQLYLLEIFDKY